MLRRYGIPDDAIVTMERMVEELYGPEIVKRATLVEEEWKRLFGEDLQGEGRPAWMEGVMQDDPAQGAQTPLDSGLDMSMLSPMEVMHEAARILERNVQWVKRIQAEEDAQSQE